MEWPGLLPSSSAKTLPLLNKEIIEKADMGIEIPMYGHKQSLNVAVAYGIVLYDCLRLLHHRKQE